ncbi:MAG: hypothetical protein QOF30_2425 [Acidimicrobiaceae bacterium]|jgi:hypothetical protein|nr:hypothetical protein [Acidimicrobiaceae bacterium]
MGQGRRSRRAGPNVKLSLAPALAASSGERVAPSGAGQVPTIEERDTGASREKPEADQRGPG